MRLDLQGNDIRGMLINLGYDPVIEGKVARIDADLSWAGAPEGEFLHRASGNLNVTMEQGALLELDPAGLSSGRIGALERFIERAKAHDGVWFASRSQIAEHWASEVEPAPKT